MNIALLGYGKMGKLIGELAETRGHQIVGKINLENQEERDLIDPKTVDVAIEFSQPEAAVDNIKWAIHHQIPVLSGTTGWLSNLKEIEELTYRKNGTFFYASNFSIGVNIFFKVNEFLAQLMHETQGYQIEIEEIHHTEKKDAPSGTAITLAEGILKHLQQLKNWQLQGDLPVPATSLPITSKRIDPAPGTHHVRFISEIDTLEIIHTAHSRQGFALGAIQVAEWILGKKGVLSMNDYLSF